MFNFIIKACNYGIIQKKRVDLSIRKEKANYVLHKYYPGKQ